MTRQLLFALAITVLAVGGTARADLLGYWDFDDYLDAANALDSSGNGNTGTITTATYSADAAGHTLATGDRAMDFGTTDNSATVSIAAAASGAFNSTQTNDAVTISLWAYGHSSQPQNDTIFGFYGGGRRLQSHLPWSNQNIYWDTHTTDGGRLNKQDTTTAHWKGQWNHYAFVKEGDRTSIYQNGTAWAGKRITTSLGAIDSASVGSSSGGALSYGGLVDDFAIWDGKISDAEIAALAAKTITPLEATATLNVAPLGTATQSSVGSGGVPTRGNDGNTDGTYNNGSVTHTLGNQSVSWWEVDLGDDYEVNEIVLWNRGDCCGIRLSNFRVSLFDGASEVFGQDFHAGAGNVPQGGSEVVDLGGFVTGDRVRVELIGGLNNDNNSILSLAEVEVFAIPEPATLTLAAMGLLALRRRRGHGQGRRSRR